MALTGRTPRECFGQFEQHVRTLISATIPTSAIIKGVQLDPAEGVNRMMLAFLRGDPTVVPIDTQYGHLFLGLFQTLSAVEEKGRYVLKTDTYNYRIQATPDERCNALIRWEYDSATPLDGPSRHHVQTQSSVAIPGLTLDLDRLHTPTGWVTIEEIVRFLIVDLGMKPAREGWADILGRSEKQFMETFSPKRPSTQK